MTTDLTPEELAGLRERAEKATPGPWWPTERWNRYSPTWHTGEIVATGNEVICQPVHDGEFDPAWLEDAAGHPNTAHIAGLDPETVLRLVVMAERAARYREWITEFICPMHLGTSEPCAVEDCEDARAALAEPEEAQHGDD